MNKVLIQTLENILNQSHTMPFCVELVDSTDNGTFKQAEIQMTGVWVGDVDIESMMSLTFVDMASVLEKKALSFRSTYEKATSL
jgi:hypothetical protein